MTIATGQSLSSYQLRLEGFEGPLDVLLRLIEQQQMEISNLSLVAVTDGFLAHIEQLQNPPPRLLAEFATIAARLLVLKSRALLPKPEAGDADEEVDDLTEQLRAYRQARQLAAFMRECHESGWRSYQRSGPPPDREVNVRLALPGLGEVRRAFLRAVARQPRIPDIAPIRRVISIPEMARRIIGAALRLTGRRSFSEVVEVGDRHETVAGFIALLALWSRREIEASQDEMFGEIYFQAPASKG